jgi:hypothetical protein
MLRSLIGGAAIYGFLVTLLWTRPFPPWWAWTRRALLVVYATEIAAFFGWLPL